MATNAVAAIVLSAQLVLPAFNRFAERAVIDVRLPLEENRITKSHSGKLSPSLMVIFDHHHQFNWNSHREAPYIGEINYYDNKSSVARLEGPQLRELTKQKSVISTNEAREVAELCLKNLGFDLKKVKAGPPHVIQWMFDPEKPGAEQVPLPAYAVRWFPKGIKEPHWSQQLVQIEVSGLTKKVTSFSSLHGAAAAVAIDLRHFMTNRTEKIQGPP